MQRKLSLLSMCLLVFFISAQAQLTFHSYSAKTIKGDSISLSQFKGKRILVVNTASFCGYTPQFEQLEQLYSLYKSNNFEIIGFPCNDFGSQDPYEDSIIDDFCKDNYGVTFQMMSKVPIIKGDTAPVYKWLQKAKLNGVKNVNVSWNFNKFLIDEYGRWVKYYPSTKSPLDTSIVNWILKPFSAIASDDQSADEMIKLQSANPSASTIDLLIQGSQNHNMTIALYSMDGKLISTIYNGSSVRPQLVSYNVSSLQNGIYLIKAERLDRMQTIRFSVQR